MREIFPIVPPSASPFWVLAPIALFLLLALGFLAFVASFLRHGSVELSGQQLRLRVPLYGRAIPLASLAADPARAADLGAEPDLRLRWRTNGIGLPGYSLGWFRLGGGGKALAAISDPHHVAVIPTRDGYTLLVSVPDPQALVNAIRRPR